MLALPASFLSFFVSIAAGANEAPSSLRFFVLGDWGREGCVEQKAVALAMGGFGTKIKPEFVASVGDNFYETGVKSTNDPKWKSSFEDVYTAPSLQVPWYAVLGNHDGYGNPDAQIEYAKSNKRWRMPAKWYSVSQKLSDGTAIDLFFLDSDPYQGNTAERLVAGGHLKLSDTTAQLAWIDSALAASKAPWKFVFLHHPLRSHGKHEAEAAANASRFEARFVRNGIAAVFAGHDHDLQHIVEPGIRLHHFVSGAGSTVRKVKSGYNTLFAASVPGFMTVSVTRDTTTVMVVDSAGSILHTTSFARPR
jgi:tartrate-resistant acid phosphatase type 5